MSFRLWVGDKTVGADTPCAQKKRGDQIGRPVFSSGCDHQSGD